MSALLLAIGRALRSLGRRGVLWHLLWPGLVAALIWLLVGILSWGVLIATVLDWVLGWPGLGAWLSSSEAATAVLAVLVKIAVFLLFVPLIYITAAVLVGAVALPLILEKVSVAEYGDLELRCGGSTLGSVWNTAAAATLFVCALLLSLPLWLIPGLGLVITVALTAWLNQRAFAYDALMLHADADELAALPRVHRLPMLTLGGLGALMAYVPVFNILAPAFCGLTFVHFMLEALRRERAEHGVTLLDPEPQTSTSVEQTWHLEP